MVPFRRLQFGMLFACLALCTPPTLARTAREAPVPSQGKLGQDLFLAINGGDLSGVKSLLARRADPNARNGLEMTPLMLASASGQVPVMEALLGAGAKLDASCIFGTALTFAVMTGSSPAAKFLLARGANVNPRRPDGITPLMLAARDGNPEMVRELLSRKVDVNATDGDGATALIYAARDGHGDAGRLLLRRGATIDAADSHRWTALMYAAVNGHDEFVKLLLEKGANVNARDGRGRTPLVLAATYGDHPAVLRALVEGGADLHAEDGKNRTALTLASTRGYEESATFLRERVVPAAVAAATTVQRTPQAAVQASLTTLQGSMRVFTKLTGCISCHQEGLGRIVTGAARERGLATDPAVAKAQVDRICGALTALKPLHVKALQDPAAMKNVPLVEIGEVPPSYTFMLAGLIAHKQPANEAISAAAQVLARQQLADGHWQFTLHRVPMQSSYFTMTALAVQVMRAYVPRSRGAEVADRLRRAKTWLLTAPAQTSDDLAFRLLGLKWAGASLEERRKAIDALQAAQRPDGGWSQEATMHSDAYATGQALYALHVGGGMPVTDPVYQRGAQFLLRTQDEDGSWFVAKRAIPANNYFDAQFPHGQSQYASFNATCWATLALMQQIDKTRPSPQQAAR